MLISLRRRPARFRIQFRIVVSLVLTMVLLELVNLFTGRALNQWGILPRYIPSLWTLPLAPLLHGNVWHLTSNLVPFAVFAFLLFQHGLQRFWLVSIGITLFGGLGVWLFGRPALHVGASLLIFGYFGYLLLAGLISQEIRLLLITLGVAFLYGGMIWGVLPQQTWVSYEAHLSGFLVGLGLAVLFGRARSG